MGWHRGQQSERPMGFRSGFQQEPEQNHQTGLKKDTPQAKHVEQHTHDVYEVGELTWVSNKKTPSEEGAKHPEDV